MAAGYRSRRIFACTWVGVLTLAAAVFGQRIIYVDDDHPGDKGPNDPTVSNSKEDGSPGSPFDAIQEGIDAAQDGDIVEVANGVYFGLGNLNLNFHGRRITVRSALGPEGCTIDSQFFGRAFVFESGEGPESVVEGFTMINGLITTDPTVGGAIRIEFASPTIRDCVFSGNTAGGFPGGDGGAIYLRQSTARILRCRFENNVATNFFGRGGAISINAASPIIEDCVIENNNAGFTGGGVLCDLTSSPTIRRTLIRGNMSSFGGGVVFQSGCNAKLMQSVIRDNRAASTPGVLISQSDPTLSDLLIVDNLSTGTGGAVDVFGGAAAVIRGSTIVGNTSAGISCSSSTVLIENSIISENGGPGDDLVGCTARYSLISDGDAGVGNIRGDPGFRDQDDYRLRPNSRCRNVGDPLTMPPPGSVDLGGVPRIICGRIDMGAYEFGLGDANCDGFITTADIGVWSSCATGPANPQFNTACSALDYNNDGIIDLTDLAAFMNAFGSPIP